MLQILKKNSVRICLIILASAIVFLIAVPIYQRATRKTLHLYENGIFESFNLTGLCKESTFIARGTVSRVEESRLIAEVDALTPVHLSVTKVYKGDADIQSVVFYEEYGIYDNTEYLYYPPSCTQFPIKKGDDIIVFLRTEPPLSLDAAGVCRGGVCSVRGTTVEINNCIENIHSLPGIGDDLTMSLSEFEALIADNL